MAKDEKTGRKGNSVRGDAKEEKGRLSDKVKPESNSNKYGNPKALRPAFSSGSGKVNKSRSAGSGNEQGYQAESVLEHAVSRPESRMTSMEKMEVTNKGISKKELEQLKKKAGLDYDQLAYLLQVARATLIAKKGSEKFSPLQSEKIMGVADIYSYGYEVFGNEPAFNKWIFEPIAALGGKSPYEVMDNQYGREEIKHIIGRIEYGVYS